MKGNEYINVNVYKLKTIMNRLNHTKIDLLKIDIEGCECEVIEQMLLEKIYPLYLSVDFDTAAGGEQIDPDVNKCKNIIKLLLDNGYKIYDKYSQDYTFFRCSL